MSMMDDLKWFSFLPDANRGQVARRGIAGMDSTSRWHGIVNNKEMMSIYQQRPRYVRSA